MIYGTQHNTTKPYHSNTTYVSSVKHNNIFVMCTHALSAAPKCPRQNAQNNSKSLTKQDYKSDKTMSLVCGT